MLTYQQVADWFAFAKINGPVGTGRADHYAVMQAHAGGSPVNPSDYLWWLKPPPSTEDGGDGEGGSLYVPTVEERLWVQQLAAMD